MKYAKPNMELVVLETVDIITFSADKGEENNITPPDEW